MVDALNKSLAVIEFDLTGNILHANDNFLGAMGYTLEEIKGKHHSMFVTPEYAHSAEYRSFWDNLGRGQYQSSEFPRVAKGGREIWIQASYNPIFNSDGKPFKVVKFAADITEQKLKSVNAAGQLEAINRAQAVIEFNMDGTIIHANDNFLSTVGYSLDEIRGKHHSMFVESGYGQSNEYRLFWDALNRGEFKTAEFRRFGKNGKEIWIQASYNPILDPSGKPIKVVKFATDITEQKQITADITGQISAIRKSQAVIEFELDGTIRHANENFLATVGYSLEEIQGKHHSMFVDSETRNSYDYQQFWKKLAAGEFQSGEFRRIGKTGKEIWIQASYNPIFDASNKPVKVVKYASDVTEQKTRNADFEGQISAIGKSQAVIEFNMDGTIRTANDNFLGAVGYTLDEIRGKHHSIFVDPAYAASPEYHQFWEKLRSGEFESAEFQRVGKGGNEIWIQASYNPIFDANGVPFKVVKYASDITAKNALLPLSAKALSLCPTAI